MALQGHGLLVEEADLRRAENLGDMSRREPVRLGGVSCGSGEWETGRNNCKCHRMLVARFIPKNKTNCLKDWRQKVEVKWAWQEDTQEIGLFGFVLPGATGTVVASERPWGAGWCPWNSCTEESCPYSAVEVGSILLYRVLHILAG